MIVREGHRLDRPKSNHGMTCSKCGDWFSDVFLARADVIPSCLGSKSFVEGDDLPRRHRYDVPDEGWEGWLDGYSVHFAHLRPLRRHMSWEVDRLVGKMDYTRRWERAFAHGWMRENHAVMNRAINSGWGTTTELLGFQRPGVPQPGAVSLGITGYSPRWPLKTRDTRGAATVIQWLGTNCGRGFLEIVLRSVGYRMVAIPKGDTCPPA